MINPTVSARRHQISRSRSSARCAVSGIGVSTMLLMLPYNGGVHVCNISKPFAEFLGHPLIAVGIFLPFERRQILANGILEFLTGPTQLPVGPPEHAGHFWETLRSQDDQRHHQNKHQFWESNPEHRHLLSRLTGV